MSANGDQIITLIALDGVKVSLSRKAAAHSEILSYTFGFEEEEDGPPEGGYGPVELPKFGSPVYQVAAEYLTQYAEEKMIPIADPEARPELVAPTFEENVPQVWYQEFVKKVGRDLPLLYSVRRAAQYLHIHDVSLFLVIIYFSKENNNEYRHLTIVASSFPFFISSPT